MERKALAPVGKLSQVVDNQPNGTSHTFLVNGQGPQDNFHVSPIVQSPSPELPTESPKVNGVFTPNDSQAESSKELPPVPAAHQTQVINDLVAKNESLSQQLEVERQQRQKDLTYWRNRTSEATSKNANPVPSMPLSQPDTELRNEWRNLVFDVRNFIDNHFNKIITEEGRSDWNPILSVYVLINAQTTEINRYLHVEITNRNQRFRNAVILSRYATDSNTGRIQDQIRIPVGTAEGRTAATVSRCVRLPSLQGTWCFFSTLVNAAFSIGGIEAAAVVGGEAKNPRRNIPKAVLPSIINAVILSSASSAANAMTFNGSRYLFALLPKNGQTLKIFQKCNTNSPPWVAVLLVTALSLLSYLSCSASSSVAFTWFQNRLTWFFICLIYIRYHSALKAQGIDRSSLVFKVPFQP
ncbi:amino acid transporter AAT family [Fusarium phyllophilum]|uniref:Amino acid transporter AAT family n=1 Tax=Fusarium phyllophilum TaxID=47803 RepID=A0A8H5MYJ8_9HYPO|nr:amino acid transporter AAT family [Fusarium phyllophilum]